MLAEASFVNFIKWFTDNVVNPINEGPVWLAVMVMCLITGWILKLIPIFPNPAIPALIVVIGGSLCVLGAGEEPKGMSHFSWGLRNFAIGMCVGTFAWAGRKYVWKALLAKFKVWFPGVEKAIEDSDTAPPFPTTSASSELPISAPAETQTKTETKT
jgi:hypothetical protein